MMNLQNSEQPPTESARAIQVLTEILGLGLTVVIIFAFQSGSVGATATICLTIAGASLLVGGLLGFLFGIPRTLQDGAVQVSAAVPNGENQGAGRVVQYLANTNLEDVVPRAVLVSESTK